MRYVILFAVAAMIAGIQPRALGQVRGEGEIVKQELDISSFNGVKLGFSGNIYLTQGSSQKVIVESQQNIIDNIKRDVKNGVWYVTFDRNVRTHKGVKVYITMPTLTEVGVSGSGNIVTESSFTGLGHVETYVSGSGDIEADLQANSVEGAISGSGEITLKGSSGSLKMRISGSGDVMAEDHKTDDCEITISGSGDAKVWATGTLEATVSGSGDIRYKGEPSNVKARVSGSGDVRQM